MDEEDTRQSRQVLHVVVVGFHHKKGCQVEYSYPPMVPSSPEQLPSLPAAASPREVLLPAQWKHLPSLALPDGSHNFDSDTCYFHLPDLEDPRKTVFGISCYRQMDASKVVNRTADITRATVQKSVCVLSRLPLFGHIQVKMALITEAYFREGDFDRVDLIHQTYDNLNACLDDDMLHSQRLYVNLSARHFVQRFRQRSLVLFKLLLLERKVLAFQSPVEDLCGFLLTLLSLHPGMLERGLDEASCLVPPDTPPPHPMGPASDKVPAEKLSGDTVVAAAEVPAKTVDEDLGPLAEAKLDGISSSKKHLPEGGDSPQQKALDMAAVYPAFRNAPLVANLPLRNLGLPLRIFTGGYLCQPYVSLSYLDTLTQPSVRGYVIGATNALFLQKSGLADVIIDLEQDRFEVVSPNLAPELRKALQLTTEDLRFTDHLVRVASGNDSRATSTMASSSTMEGEQDEHDFYDGIGWEGGDEWVRDQFCSYLVSLMRVVEHVESLGRHDDAVAEDAGEDIPNLDSSDMACKDQGLWSYNHFNPTFVQLWKQTNNFRVWRRFMKRWQQDRMADEGEDEDHHNRVYSKFMQLQPAHPFAGQLSVSDMKLFLSNTMTNTEGGKRVTQAVASTGRAVAGGLSSAKGALSSLFTSLKTFNNNATNSVSNNVTCLEKEPDQVK